MKKKKPLQKIWWFIWEDESIWSWIVNVILAFVIIKFLIYPGLGFMLGTTHPVVAVISGSMEHDGSFDDWWEYKCKINELVFQQADFYASKDIDKQTFKTFRFKNGFNTGDLMILKSKKDLELGDIIVFQPPQEREPVIHRIIEITEQNGNNYYTTKGDHNCGSSQAEDNLPESAIIGEAVGRVPFLGMIKLGFIKFLQLFGVA